MKTTKGASLRDIFVETDYLQTVVIIVSSNQEKEFLHGYQLLAATAVTPAVVPGSARKLLVDAEGYVVYSVVILKKYLSELEKVDAADDSEEVKLAQYEAEEKKLKVGMQ